MMTTTTPGSRHWIGPCLLGVAALHTLAAAVLFRPALQQMAERGLFNSVAADPRAAAAAWFVLAGALLALLALVITPLERSGQRATLRRLGAGLLALTALGLLLMPTSGFWLVLPPAIALLRR